MLLGRKEGKQVYPAARLSEIQAGTGMWQGEDEAEPQRRDRMQWDAQPTGERNWQSPSATHQQLWMQSKVPALLWSMKPAPGASVRADMCRGDVLSRHSPTLLALEENNGFPPPLLSALPHHMKC